MVVRCPHDLDPLMRAAGGLWEPGGRRWLLTRGRMGPLLRELRRATDPLFRQAGIDLDGRGRPEGERAASAAQGSGEGGVGMAAEMTCDGLCGAPRGDPRPCCVVCGRG